MFLSTFHLLPHNWLRPTFGIFLKRKRQDECFSRGSYHITATQARSAVLPTGEGK